MSESDESHESHESRRLCTQFACPWQHQHATLMHPHRSGPAEVPDRDSRLKLLQDPDDLILAELQAELAFGQFCCL
jgi:hypothetical protein